MNLLNRSFSHIYIEKEAKQYEENFLASALAAVSEKGKLSL